MRLPAVLEDARDRVLNLVEGFDALADRRWRFAEREDRAWALLTLLLVGHVLVWTLQPLLSHNNLADSVDMVENWAWGQEWQLGYWKHPPFFAWVTAAWFAVFPRADWAYYLLAAVNSAVGLAGVWAMTGVIDHSPRRRLVAVAALAVTPIYGFLALKFNANAMLLSVWPWAAWAFLKAVKRPGLVNGAVLGLLLAVAMLSKYVSLVLVVGMIVVVLAEPRRWALMRSPAAVGAVVVGLVAFAPHAIWMIATDFRTLAYAEHQRAASTGQFLNYLIRLPFSMLLFLAPMIAVVLVSLPRGEWSALRRVFAWVASDGERRRVLGLGIAPFVATCLLGAWKWAKLSSQWGFPLMFTASWLLVSAPGVEARRFRLDRVALLVALIWTGLVATAPVVNLAGTLAQTKVHVDPRAELAHEVTRIWHEANGGARLAVVAGTFELANNTAFYSADAPSVLTEFDFLKSPWLTPEGVRRSGVAVICDVDDADCAAKARSVLDADPTPRIVTVSKHWFGFALKPRTVHLFLRLPAAGA